MKADLMHLRQNGCRCGASLATQRRWVRRLRRLALAVDAGLFLLTTAARADSYSWSNSTNTNNTWSRGQSWLGGVAPSGTNTDVLVFNDLNNTTYTA